MNELALCSRGPCRTEAHLVDMADDCATSATCPTTSAGSPALHRPQILRDPPGPWNPPIRSAPRLRLPHRQDHWQDVHNNLPDDCLSWVHKGRTNLQSNKDMNPLHCHQQA
jgi:hypothetical protein